MQPPRKGRAGTVVAVLVLVLVLLGGLGAGTWYYVTNQDDPDSSTPPAPPGPGCADPQNFIGNAVLGNAMTSAVQRHSAKAWLALASTDEARSAMERWWANVSAIGFTTGGAAPSSDPKDVRADSIVMRIGFHTKLDSVSSGKANAPSTRYRISTKQVEGKKGCHLVITAFDSLEHAPWDDGTLDVVRTPHAVVVGSRPGTAAQFAPYVERGVTWTTGFYQAAGQRDDVAQRGLVVFVPGTKEQERTWFRAEPGDTGSAAYSYRLPGVQLPGIVTGPPGVTVPSVKELSAGEGGARVVLTAAGRGLSPDQLGSLFVGQFVDSVYQPIDINAQLGGGGAPAAVTIGAARFVQAYHLTNPGDPQAAARSGTPAALSSLTSVISQRGGFDGRWPSDQQFKTSTSADFDYYASLAASTFGYEADVNDLHFALQCIRNAYVQGGGPFAGIVTDVEDGTITFADPAPEQGRWATWLRVRI